MLKVIESNKTREEIIEAAKRGFITQITKQNGRVIEINYLTEEGKFEKIEILQNGSHVIVSYITETQELRQFISLL